MTGHGRLHLHQLHLGLGRDFGLWCSCLALLRRRRLYANLDRPLSNRPRNIANPSFIDICNWFGGQAISLAVNYTHSSEFAAAGYQPFTYDGVEYGEVRQFGNFSFTRIYESGHEVPFYQPQGALALFNRTINLVDIADGSVPVTANLSSTGPANATHTQAPVALPASTEYAAWSSSIVASYYSLDAELPTSTA
jgi:hypothetical protein